VCFPILHARLRVHSGIRLSLRPLFPGDISDAKLGRIARAESARSCPGRGAALFSGAPQIRDPEAHRRESWAPDRQRITFVLRCVRGTRVVEQR